jgi:GNAT superfamily N-acetyltransferase
MHMHVTTAQSADIPGWLALTRQVEPLFGAPMASDPGFLAQLQHKIDTGLAFCVREFDGPPGAVLCGGLLFSTRRCPIYQIGWLAVSEGWRRHGIGQALVEYVCKKVVPPAEIILLTFLPGDPAGEPARQFYTRLGFTAAEILSEGPNGEPRQRYRKVIK